MATSIGLPSIENTLGWLFVGAILSTALWGVSSVQLYFYYERYSKTDGFWLRLYISAIFALDTAHQILLVHSLYTYLVKHFGNFIYLTQPQGELVDVTIFAALIDAMVQSIFLLRVWKLSNGNYILTGILSACVLGLFATTVIYFGQSYGITRSSQLLSSINTVRVMNSLVVLVDTAIAVPLILLLRRNRSSMRKTNTVVKRLIVYTVGTGLVTSIWGIVGLVAAIARPASFLYLMVDVVIPKLYFNCVLASLNSRSKLREELLGVQGCVDICLDNVRSNTGRGSPSTGSTFQKGLFPSAIECKVDIDVGYDMETSKRNVRGPQKPDIGAPRSTA